MWCVRRRKIKLCSTRGQVCLGEGGGIFPFENSPRARKLSLNYLWNISARNSAFCLDKFSLGRDDLDCNCAWQGRVRGRRRLGRKRGRYARVVAAVPESRSRQQQATCCAFGSLLVLQIDAAPCEIRIYYRRIVIPFRGCFRVEGRKAEEASRREMNESLHWLRQFVLTLFMASPQY